MTLEQLSIDHPYYCSELECNEQYECWDDFLAEMGSADKDYNLLFRFDIKKRADIENDETIQGYGMELFFIQQRKGRGASITITEIKESESRAIIEYLTERCKHLYCLWEPINQFNNPV